MADPVRAVDVRRPTRGRGCTVADRLSRRRSRPASRPLALTFAAMHERDGTIKAIASEDGLDRPIELRVLQAPPRPCSVCPHLGGSARSADFATGIQVLVEHES